MLRTDLPDHRRSSDEQLLAALRGRDPLALAEAYHRSVPAAHAVARRLLSGSTEVEALLRVVYTELWNTPPDAATTALEGWVRQRIFTLGAAHLREGSTAPASPSTAQLLPDLPAPDVRYLDTAERALSELADDERRVLLRAHDEGLPADRQGGQEQAQTLLRDALLALAGPDSGADADAVAADSCEDLPGLADWTLGLSRPADAAALTSESERRPGCAALVRALKRGRRRLEGLPPTPDMGQRVLVTVLAGSPAPAASAAAPSGQATQAMALPSALDPQSAVALDKPAGGQRSLSTLLGGEVAGAAGSEWAADDEDDPTEDFDKIPVVASDPDALAHLGAGGSTGSIDLDHDGDSSGLVAVNRRGSGQRVLLWLGGLLLMAGGIVLGLYLGSLAVNAL